MSNAIQLVTGDIMSARDGFMSVLADQSLNFEREAGFAIQIISANDYSLGIAQKNRQSVVDAVTNLAAIGLSLNPATKQAYLVPRDGKICLDVSYRGLIDLAVDTGSILWAQAKVVYATETLELRGLDQPPLHTSQPFAKDKGEIVGAYVVAKTRDGDYLTEAMSIGEINEIRDRSSAWKAWVKDKKKCPWVTDPAEMCRKTVVKRGSKYWPRSERLDRATHYLNTENGEGLAELQPQRFDVEEWLKKIPGAQTEADLMAIYTPGMAAAAEVKDRAGAETFKKACLERRAAIRNSNTFENEKAA